MRLPRGQPCFFPALPHLLAMKFARKPRPPSALQLAMDTGNPALIEAVEQSRKLLHRKALTAALASATPIPGLDMAVDAALLSRLIPQISTNFGLSDDQIARLSPAKRDKVQNTVNMLGGVLIGKLITKDVIMRAAKALGMRLTAQQASKYVPIAGQAVAAALGYATLRYLGEQHLRDCVRVAHEAGIVLPIGYARD
ncbi:uncharacterized protein (DUF697 family) [Comamonas sp. 4034]